MLVSWFELVSVSVPVWVVDLLVSKSAISVVYRLFVFILLVNIVMSRSYWVI